jgi:hypothetical protein
MRAAEGESFGPQVVRNLVRQAEQEHFNLFLS